MSQANIGRYQIVAELGKGAMGVVYKALDPNIGRTVALKTVRVDAAGVEADELVKRFKNEARAAGVLNHPNIVTIYDADEQNGTLYIAMEYIEGTTLQALLAEQRVLPVERVVEIGRQICAGLEFAQSKGVVHRDVKPANIMIAPDGSAKVMDFGIAKAGATLTHTGQVLGTPSYMSPEQVRGRTLDGRSDLFSLGVILYEMVTGERPFAGECVTTIIYKIVNENPVPPRELDMSIHPGMSAIILKALAKSPDERFQSGSEMAQALLNYKSAATTTDPTVVLGSYPAIPGGTVVAPAGSAPNAAAMGSGAMRPVPAGQGATTQSAPAAPPAPPAVSTTRVQEPRVPTGVGMVPPPATLERPASPALAPPRPPVTPPAYRSHKGLWITAIVLALLLVAVGVKYKAAQDRLKADEQRLAEQARKQQPESLPSEPKPVQTPAPPPAQQEKPPTPAAPTTGELQIGSNPDGAKVQIDDRVEDKWVTPFTAPHLKPGRHTLSFTKDGYKPVTQKAEVIAGRKVPVSAELQQIPATLVISSNPAGAAIFVDESDTGQVTPAQVSVGPGQHKVVVRKPGFKWAGTMADVGAGQSLNFSPTLQRQVIEMQGSGDGNQNTPNTPGERMRRYKEALQAKGAGYVMIRTHPKGAQILVNGNPAMGLTPFRLPLPPGTYRLTLQLDGYKPLNRQMVVEKDRTVQMNEFLEPR